MEDESILQIDAEEGIATAEAVSFFNDLFDSVNGSENNECELRSLVREDSAHHEFWVKAKCSLRNMCYVDRVTRKPVRTVPTIKNWSLTLDGFQKLWKILHCKYGFTSLKPRNCNQDPIENLFGQIRSHASRNTNPTPRQFEDSFITLLISNLKSIKIVSGNCETVEDSFILQSFEQYLENDLETDPQIPELCDDDNDDDSNDYDEPLELLPEVVVHEETYSDFISQNLDEIITSVVKQLNYCQECNDSLKNSNRFVNVASQIMCRLFKLLETRSFRRNILEVLVQHFQDWCISMNWHECTEHHNNIFITIVRVIARKTLVWWCKKRNKLNATTDENIQLYTQDIVQIKKARETYRLQKCDRKKMLNEYKLSVREKMKK